MIIALLLTTLALSACGGDSNGIGIHAWRSGYCKAFFAGIKRSGRSPSAKFASFADALAYFKANGDDFVAGNEVIFTYANSTKINDAVNERRRAELVKKMRRDMFAQVAMMAAAKRNPSEKEFSDLARTAALADMDVTPRLKAMGLLRCGSIK